MDYKYIGFVGCYTKAGQADPFEANLGGYPHDRTKIGTGVLAIGVDASGKLSFLNGGAPIITAAELPNPSYLCILERSDSSSRPAALRDGGLCIVSELDEGKFQTFAVSCNKTDMKVSAKAVAEAVNSGGSYPCHIISGKVGSDVESVIICNYGETEGVLSVFRLGNGKKGSVQIRFGSGSKVDLDRQEGSHAHSTSILTPLSSSSLVDLCVADLGSDEIFQFSMNTSSTDEDGDISLTVVEMGKLKAPPGSGPRSLMFNPVLSNIAVVSLEMTSEVWLIRRKTEDGSLEGLSDPVSVLPDNWPEESSSLKCFNGGRWASDAVWSPDGLFIYAAARIHNSISVFQLCNSSELKLVQRVSSEGLTPRCLCMSECGKFVLIAHQHSHEITSFQRNESDGTISFTDRLEVANAAVVKLIPTDQIG